MSEAYSSTNEDASQSDIKKLGSSGEALNCFLFCLI